MWVAFAVAAALIAFFVGRLAGALRKSEADLAAAREAAARNERLAALTTLAAGAAHELGSPLATIAVAAKEIERAAAAAAAGDAGAGAAGAGAGAGGAVAEDARLIRAELERCRAILDQMTAGAGGAPAEPPAPLRLDALVAEIARELAPGEAARFGATVAPAAAEIEAPRGALARVLRTLVHNALEASVGAAPGEGTRVELAATVAGGRARFEVRDRGTGMSAETLAHAGEPFFTTKEPGRGLGLGLYLARAFAERMGGTLALSSSAGEGTVARLEIAAPSVGPALVPAGAPPAAAGAPARARAGVETA